MPGVVRRRWDDLGMARQRLSQRSAGAAPDGPYEGVPEHLGPGLAHWWREIAEAGSGGYFGNERPLRALVAHLRLNINPAWNAAQTGRELLRAASGDDELFLDMIDGTLDVYRVADVTVAALSRLLDVSGSVWTVAPDKSLARVVSDEAQATYDAATAPADEAATELQEAWGNAFGRNGDPSDAWDHAIKAVEDVLIPVVVPSKAKATLGDVLGQLGSAQSAGNWKMILPGNDQTHDVAPLVAMLRLMWPNHDRHGGNTPKRTPSAEEARAVVTLAATILQWHREGWVVQKR